jgi:DNA-binding GntR family transcriptional regulator
MNKRNQAYIKIRHAIMFGILKPGEQLVERRISKEFDIGRTPLREAFWQLEKDGFLHTLPNKGAFVLKLSIGDFEEIAEVVAKLEAYGVELAVKNIMPDQLKKLQEFTENVVISAKSGDYMAYSDSDFKFHDYLQEIHQNKSLMTKIVKYRVQLFRTRALSKALFDNVDEFLDDHQEIFAAVAEGNPKNANKAMQMHVRHAKTYFIRFFEENPWIL